MMAKGYWKVSSKSDPRFDCSGEGLVGMFVCPPDAKKKIEELEKELGCEAPDDLEFFYLKD